MGTLLMQGEETGRRFGVGVNEQEFQTPVEGRELSYKQVVYLSYYADFTAEACSLRTEV